MPTNKPGVQKQAGKAPQTKGQSANGHGHGQTQPPSRIPDRSAIRILGYPDGQCQVCYKHQAIQACWVCGAGAFCGRECCEWSLTIQTHRCVQAPPTTASILLEAVDKGTLPGDDPRALEDYFFDQENPLVWSELHKIYALLQSEFALSAPTLALWKRQNQVHDNIVRLFNKYPDRVPPQRALWLHEARTLHDKMLAETASGPPKEDRRRGDGGERAADRSRFFEGENLTEVFHVEPYLSGITHLGRQRFARDLFEKDAPKPNTPKGTTPQDSPLVDRGDLASKVVSLRVELLHRRLCAQRAIAQ